MNVYGVAAVWIALALAASLISIRVGIAVALAEILVGAISGNVPGLSGLVQQTVFTSFLASLGSVMLTFLAAITVAVAGLVLGVAHFASHRTARQ